MKPLELFSGTGSVGRVAREFGFSVISLDLKNAHINEDILKWEYKTYEKHFDIISFGFRLLALNIAEQKPRELDT